MRFTRPALAAVTALLAVTGLGTAAYADNNDNGTSNFCFIYVTGDHNTDACGNISYGDNATTGQGHTTGLGTVNPPATPSVVAVSLFRNVDSAGRVQSSVSGSCPSDHPYLDQDISGIAPGVNLIAPPGTTVNQITTNDFGYPTFIDYTTPGGPAELQIFCATTPSGSVGS
ncbi:hypothetical protein [Streptomyces sp. NRRL F-2664]|uniref:hypothetical protein n=1 Tax=Streptomyces sp. NRRL F-2664 TaxID=1463842 RepID=UPI0004CA454E|nr:hypothetical protein [Streptomyces sp. NRRL F-2664]